MNTLPDAVRLADWLENEPGYDWNRNYCLAVAELRRLHEENKALRQALAQPEQEPVAWMTHTDRFMPLFHNTRESALNWQTQPTPIPIYTAPPKREWVGLTGLEQKELMAMNSRYAVFETEAKLKEKNGG